MQEKLRAMLLTSFVSMGNHHHDRLIVEISILKVTDAILFFAVGHNRMPVCIAV